MSAAILDEAKVRFLRDLGVAWTSSNEARLNEYVKEYLVGDEKTLRVCTEYSVKMRENGHRPVLYPEHNDIEEITEELKKEFEETFTGIAEVWITINRGSFSMTAGVVVTYNPISTNFHFEEIHLVCHLLYEGEPPQPLEQLIDSIVSYYEQHSRLSDYTDGEYNIRKMLLTAAQRPTSAKRVRLD